MTLPPPDSECLVVEVLEPLVSISVVSHGQARLVKELIADIERACVSGCELILTLNIHEHLPFDTSRYNFPIRIIRNAAPKGFGANHNSAFRIAQGKYFCVVNPDIRFSGHVLEQMASVFREKPRVGIVAPLVRNPNGSVEDSARRFPGIFTPFLRIFGGNRRLDYPDTAIRFEPDWVAGMFMMFPASVYAAVGGFDERFFLYYEDVDLCARLRLAGYRIIVEPQVFVVHAARRDSHRKLKYLWWHISSALRFFTSPVFWRVMMRTIARVDGAGPA